MAIAGQQPSSAQAGAAGQDPEGLQAIEGRMQSLTLLPAITK